jgi:hypothetical protein
MRRVRGCLLALVGLLAPAGCRTSSATTQGATDAVERYRVALERDDARAAYALLSARVQREVPFPVFEDVWAAQKDERARQARGLASGPVRPVTPTSSVELGDGQRSRLQFEDGGWRLVDPLLAIEAAGSPREAALLFADAIETRNVAGFSLLLTPSRREQYAKTGVNLVNALRNDKTREVNVIGNTATVTVRVAGGATWILKMTRDASGRWRIDDIR